MTISILDCEYNRGVDASIEAARDLIVSLRSMGAEFEKGQFDWVHDRIACLEQLITYLENTKKIVGKTAA